MKFYSEVTKKCYDTATECQAAEDQHKAEIEAKELEAKQKKEAYDKDKLTVQRCYEDLQTARELYYKAVREFNAKHGAYTVEFNNLSDLWKHFIND